MAIICLGPTHIKKRVALVSAIKSFIPSCPQDGANTDPTDFLDRKLVMIHTKISDSLTGTPVCGPLPLPYFGYCFHYDLSVIEASFYKFEARHFRLHTLTPLTPSI